MKAFREFLRDEPLMCTVFCLSAAVTAAVLFKVFDA